MKAIIIGATSGIGRELAKVLSSAGYEICITGRRVNLLMELQKELSTKCHVFQMDITELEASRNQFPTMVETMGGVDVVVINAGVGDMTSRWHKELQIINTNVMGFVALFNVAFHYFKDKKSGHLVGVSSLAALRGSASVPAYSASKAFISSYMEGYRNRSIQKKLNITVTDIRPGFVATAMTEQNKSMFWVASAEKAAKQIFNAIKRKRDVVYITKRWRIMSWVMRAIPNFIFKRTL